jgi:hypothetical protein
MYIDVPQTPKAVVICVIIFNAAFGYSWGPIPWLYPPEVGRIEQSAYSLLILTFCRSCLSLSVLRVSHFLLQRIGLSTSSSER